VHEFSPPGNLPLVGATLSPEDQTHVENMRQLMVDHGGLKASAFSVQDVLRIFTYVQQHSTELVAAVHSIIALFQSLRPSPAPTPSPDPAPPTAL
jgi:hypothetical protein